MDFTILISNSSELPIYMQIVEQIREQIVLEKVPPSTPLPSIRQLSKDLNVSVITVTNAYNKLQMEGFITSLPGKGFITCSKESTEIQYYYRNSFYQYLKLAIRNAHYIKIPYDEIEKTLSKLYFNKSSNIPLGSVLLPVEN